MDEKYNKIAFVVLSCDPYSDLWDCYGQLFNRFWPDCPFNCYMASHHVEFNKYGFKSILLGEDISWSHGLIVLLDNLKTKEYKSVLIVAHSGISKAFYAYFNGIPQDGEFLNLGLKNCEIKEYEL